MNRPSPRALLERARELLARANATKATFDPRLEIPAGSVPPETTEADMWQLREQWRNR